MIDLARPSVEVAPLLLGLHLTHETDQGLVTVKLTEVEAYAGVTDPASHSYRGLTPRNAVMFGPPGRLYVYFSYGMHWCANLVTSPEGEATAVLLRAGRVIDGVELARVRRGPKIRDRSLARGPANLTQALGITKEHNGVDVVDGGALRLEGPRRDDLVVSTGPRVGVSQAADVPLRFWIDGDETVSAYKRSIRAPKL